jgi:hypothetical protein
LYDYIPERKKVQGIFRPRRDAAGETGAERREDRHIFKKDGAGRFTSRRNNGTLRLSNSAVRGFLSRISSVPAIYKFGE